VLAASLVICVLTGHAPQLSALQATIAHHKLMTSFIRRRSMPVISALTIRGQRKYIKLIVSTAMKVSIATRLLWPISAHMSVLKVTTVPWAQFSLVHVQQVPIKEL